MARHRQPFWTFDTETDPFLPGRLPQVFVCAAYCGENERGVEEYYEFTSLVEAIRFFETKKVIVYAHNGGKYDYHMTDFEEDEQGDRVYGKAFRDYINSDQPVMVINGRLARFKIGEAEFRDSLNIFPNTKLEQFQGKIKIDYAKFEKDRRSDPNIRAEISVYLRQDCKLLWEVVARYRKDYGCSLTQAGASMKYWTKMSKLEAPRQTKAQHDRYRPYYYGGRVQCFEYGVRDAQFSVADINSAYPFGMLSNHPFCTEAQLLDHLPATSKIEKCLVKVDAISRGALPWRDPNDGELYFPDDEAGSRHRVRTYSVTGWELLTGLELDAIKVVNVREVHYFPQTVNFKEYIEYFYNLREEARLTGDVAGRTFGKYFMNGLYGKFGANPENYSEYVIASVDTYTGWMLKGYRYYKPWGERYLMERSPTEEDLNDANGKWRFYNVATAASVTGYVRAHLFKALSRCSGLVYCDTDSVAARDTSRLEYGTQLGQWKHEGRFDSYAIAGKKLYAFHEEGAEEAYDPEADKPTWKIASKGVNFAALASGRQDAQGHSFPSGPEVIARIARGEKIVHEPDVPTYTIAREKARFISRSITRTAKDMSVAPDGIAA